MIGETVNGARLWVHVGAAPVPARRAREDLLIVFLAGYLREKREVLAQARLKDFGPLLVIWGAAMLVIVETNDLGSALLYFGIFLAMLYVATGRALFVAAASRCSRRRRARATRRSAARRRARRHWLDPWRRRRTARGYQIVAGALLDRERRLRRHGLGKGTFTTPGRARPHPVPRHRLHLRRARPGARARRRRGVAARLHAALPARLPGAMLAQDGFSKLLAVGFTFGFALQAFIIVGGVLRVIPLTGITLPVRQLRRVERRRELRHARGPAARLEPRERASWRAMNPRSARRRRRARAARGAGRRHDVLAGVGGGGLAARQDNAIQRVAQFKIKRGLICAADGTVLAANRRRRWTGRRSTSAATRSASSRRTSSATRPRLRSRAGLERSLNDYLTGSNTNLSTVLDTKLDKLQGETIKGNDLAPDDAAAAPAGRAAARSAASAAPRSRSSRRRARCW